MAKERCIPIPQQMGIRLEAVATQQIDISMVLEVRRMRNRSMATCTQYSSDDLDTKAIHPSQWKMIKRQRTGIRLMAVGIWHADFGLRAETNFYLKRARKMGKSLITTSTQWTDSSLMAMLQWMAMSRVIVEQPTNICPQVISVQGIDSDLMAMLQWMTMPRVIAN